MLEASLFAIFTRRLDDLGVPYMASGSVAVIVYGEPRLTHDVDLIVDLKREQVPRLPQAFPPEEFYCPPVEVILQEAAREQRGHINLIHHATGFKADLYFSGRDPLHAWGMARVRTVDLDQGTLHVAPIEYVIVRKLEFYREGGSEKHLRDIRSKLDGSAELVGMNDLIRLIDERGLGEVWAKAEGYRS